MAKLLYLQQQAMETTWTKVHSYGLGLVGSVHRDPVGGGRAKHIKKVESRGRAGLGSAIVLPGVIVYSSNTLRPRQEDPKVEESQGYRVRPSLMPPTTPRQDCVHGI